MTDLTNSATKHRLIPLTQGYFAKVDDDDFERVNQFKWRALVDRRKDGRIKNVYAQRSVRNKDGKHTARLLHRFILGVTDLQVKVDHSPDRSGLNCQRNNLRLASNTENAYNARLSAANSSGVKGVYWNTQHQKWIAQIRANGKNKHLGLFTSLEDAALAYDTAAQKYFGQFALTNTMMTQVAA